MGANVSRHPTYGKLDRIIPPVRQEGFNGDYSKWEDRGVKAFVNSADREQFICSLLAVVTQNGAMELSTHDFRLLYSRRQQTSPEFPSPRSSSSRGPKWLGKGAEKSEPDDGTRLVCTLVAIGHQGEITAKIEPAMGGEDYGEAFRAFKRHIEMRLEVLLRSVLSGEPSATGASEAADPLEAERIAEEARVAAAGVEVPRDEPPAYGDVKH